MTKRTLRYDLEKTCPGEPIKREEVPVKRRAPVKKETPENKTKPINIQSEIIEQEIKKRMQSSVQERLQQKLRMKDEKMKKLSAQIA